MENGKEICTKILSEIIMHYKRGYEIHGLSFFTSPWDRLRNKLRDEYFSRYFGQIRKVDENGDVKYREIPTTRSFISSVYLEVMNDIVNSGGIDFEGGKEIKDKNDLIGRAFKNLSREGMGYIFKDGEETT